MKEIRCPQCGSTNTILEQGFCKCIKCLWSWKEVRLSFYPAAEIDTDGVILITTPKMNIMTEEQEIISDEEIERVHANANFGDMSKRDVVRMGVLKCASGYYQGSTSKRICQEHDLITSEYELTAKGREYLWAAFSGGSNF